jgi:hypothetical protein
MLLLAAQQGDLAAVERLLDKHAVRFVYPFFILRLPILVIQSL